MAYTLGNKCAKNCCKWTLLVQLIVKNVVTCFIETQCRMVWLLNNEKTSMMWLAVFTTYRRVTDGWTDRWTDVFPVPTA